MGAPRGATPRSVCSTSASTNFSLSPLQRGSGVAGRRPFRRGIFPSPPLTAGYFPIPNPYGGVFSYHDATFRTVYGGGLRKSKSARREKGMLVRVFARNLDNNCIWGLLAGEIGVLMKSWGLIAGLLSKKGGLFDVGRAPLFPALPRS